MSHWHPIEWPRFCFYHPPLFLNSQMQLEGVLQSADIEKKKGLNVVYCFTEGDLKRNSNNCHSFFFFFLF
jgi:hypothetical protein